MKSGKWNFAQLFVNDQRRCAAASAQAGLLHDRRADRLPRRRSEQQGADRFGFFAATKSAPTGRTSATSRCWPFHSWSMSRMRIAGSRPRRSESSLFAGNSPTSDCWGAVRQGPPLPGRERARSARASPASGTSTGPAGAADLRPAARREARRGGRHRPALRTARRLPRRREGEAVGPRHPVARA